MDRLMLRMYFDDDSGELEQVKESEAFAREDLLLRTDVLGGTLCHVARRDIGGLHGSGSQIRSIAQG